MDGNDWVTDIMVISRVISKQVQNPLVDEAEQPSTNFVKLESVTVVLIS